MARSEVCCALVLIAGAACPQTLPSKGPVTAAEQSAALQSIREYAHNYDQRLPDYTCTQVTHRTTSAVRLVPGARKASADVIEEQVNLVNHMEIHKVMKINGNPVSNVEHDQIPGGISKGEFGSLLGIVFDRATGTDFHFDRMATLNGRRVYVFNFRVPESRGYRLGETARTIVVAYKGSAYADYQTKAVMRIEMKCMDIPANSEIKSLDLTLDYKPARVAGQEFILPSHYLLHYRNAEIGATNEAAYNAYRRFSADATIKFDDVQ
jgi:hypothetical protein